MAVRDGELRVFLVSGEVSGESLSFPVRFSGVGGLMMSNGGFCGNGIIIGVIASSEYDQSEFELHKTLLKKFDNEWCSIFMCYLAGIFQYKRQKLLHSVILFGQCIVPGEAAGDNRGCSSVSTSSCFNLILFGHFLASWKQITRDHQNAFHLHKRYGIITSVISRISNSHPCRSQSACEELCHWNHQHVACACLIPGGSLHQKSDAFNASSVALCASGTVALGMQLARLPCLVAYSHFLTELIIRYEAKVPIVSLPNVLMDSPITPEALFKACTPTNLASLMF